MIMGSSGQGAVTTAGSILIVTAVFILVFAHFNKNVEANRFRISVPKYPKIVPIVVSICLLAVIGWVIWFYIASESKEAYKINTAQPADILPGMPTFNKPIQQEVVDPTLELISFTWRQTLSGRWLETEGLVKNTSPYSINDVQAVVWYYDGEGDFVTAEDDFIMYNPLLAGQTSPFKVTGSGTPAVKKAKVKFKFYNGADIKSAPQTVAKEGE